MRTEYVPQIADPFGMPDPNKLEKHLLLCLIDTLPTPTTRRLIIGFDILKAL